MRDIKRIDDFCNRLNKSWKKKSDLRFGQMILNIFGEMYADGKDPFYPEDDEMIKIIEDYVNKNN